MARRLYLGRMSNTELSGSRIIEAHCKPPGLPMDARSDDVAKFFDGYGRIVDVRVMTGKLRTLQHYLYRQTTPCS
jgi:hypothetical protein